MTDDSPDDEDSADPLDESGDLFDEPPDSGGDDRDADAREDPFDRLGAGPDRDGDPFEQLGGPATESGPGAESDSTDAEQPGPDEGYAEPDPFEYMDDESAEPSSGPPPDHGPGAGPGDQQRHDAGVTEPLDDVAVSGADPFDAPGGVFEQVDVGEVDPDEVWDRLTGEPEPATQPEDGEDDIVDVSKHSFCEGCEHFSAPPDVHCTHEGTEILEFTDIETVRVANCPIVAERRELGGFEE